VCVYREGCREDRSYPHVLPRWKQPQHYRSLRHPSHSLHVQLRPRSATDIFLPVSVYTLGPISSGVLLKIEVGIRKWVWQRAWRYCAHTHLWSLRWVYAVKKNPGGWYTAYTRVYPPIHHCRLVLEWVTSQKLGESTLNLYGVAVSSTSFAAEQVEMSPLSFLVSSR